MTYRVLQGLGEDPRPLVPTQTPQIIDGGMMPPPAGPPSWVPIVAGLGAIALLWQAFRPGMHANKPPRPVSFDDPRYGDAAYADSILDWERANGQKFQGRNETKYQRGLSRLKMMAEYASYKKSDPRDWFEYAWGMTRHDLLDGEDRKRAEAWRPDLARQTKLSPGQTRKPAARDISEYAMTDAEHERAKRSHQADDDAMDVEALRAELRRLDKRRALTEAEARYQAYTKNRRGRRGRRRR